MRIAPPVWFAWVVLALAAPSPTSTPNDIPAPLSCLGRWYAGEALRTDSGWFWVLPGGTHIPYDDGKNKSFQERLDAPDIEDLFHDRYATGPIAAVSTADFDPGRYRIESLLKATYGASQKQVPVEAVDFFGTTVKVHRNMKPALLRVITRLEAATAEKPELTPFLHEIGGTFVWRKVAGTDRLSAHSFATAIDLNVKKSHYWRWNKKIVWKNNFPQEIVDAFEAEGFIWGGRWYHYDTMHFEYRPELLDPGCYPRTRP